MKRLFLFVSFILFCRMLCIAQYPDIPGSELYWYDSVFNIKTPNNTFVEDCAVLKGSVPDISLDSAQILYLRNYLEQNYNGATMLAYPSYKYNCHGYAWHMKEGGDTAVVGLLYSASEDIYWNDGSYIEVPETYGTKVSYIGKNHSAVKLNNGDYESKWGLSGPLVQHHNPENILPELIPDSIKYYRRPFSISGANNIYLLQNASYYIPGLASFFPITWSVSGNATIVSGQGTNSVHISACSGSSLTLTATITFSDNIPSVEISKTIGLSPYYGGSLTVEPYLTYIHVSVNHPYATCYDWNLSDYTSSSIGTGTITCNSNSNINVTLTNGAPVGYVNVAPRTSSCTTTDWFNAVLRYWSPKIDGDNSTLNPTYGNYAYFCLQEPAPNDDGAVQYKWYFDNTLYFTTYDPYIWTTGWPCGEHWLKVKVVSNSKETEYDLAYFYGNCYSPSAAPWSAAYPNPSANELFIDRKIDARLQTAVKEKPSEIVVQLFDKDKGSLVIRKSFPSGSNKLNIDTSKLKNGNYILNVLEGKKMTLQQIIVVKR